MWETIINIVLTNQLRDLIIQTSVYHLYSLRDSIEPLVLDVIQVNTSIKNATALRMVSFYLSAQSAGAVEYSNCIFTKGVRQAKGQQIYIYIYIYSLLKISPVGWGRRIYWLHLCWGGKTPHLNNLMVRQQ